jgi:hypothetical protein
VSGHGARCALEEDINGVIVTLTGSKTWSSPHPHWMAVSNAVPLDIWTNERARGPSSVLFRFALPVSLCYNAPTTKKPRGSDQPEAMAKTAKTPWQGTW